MNIAGSRGQTNDEDNESDQDGTQLKMNDLRRRTKMDRRRYEGAKAGMVE